MYQHIAAFSIKSQPFRSITTHFIRKTSHFPDETSVFSLLTAEQIAVADSRRRHYARKHPNNQNPESVLSHFRGSAYVITF